MDPAAFTALAERRREEVRMMDAMAANVARWIYMCSPARSRRNIKLEEIMLFGRR